MEQIQKLTSEAVTIRIWSRTQPAEIDPRNYQVFMINCRKTLSGEFAFPFYNQALLEGAGMGPWLPVQPRSVLAQVRAIACAREPAKSK
jgi:hypothetical protein